MIESGTGAGPSLLGDYLRARRSLVQPEDLGLHRGTGRRVGGLRRQEVAAAAGISIDYYLRLEQGRDRQPSEQVIAALAGALRVGDRGLQHMRRLVRLQNQRAARPAGAPRGALRGLLDFWPLTPVAVVDANLDVVAANDVAQALDGLLVPGRNLLLGIFSHQHQRSPMWRDTAERAVAALRFRCDPVDPRLQELVGQLSIREPVFRRIWARHDCSPWTRGVVHFPGDDARGAAFRFQSLDVPSAAGCSVLAFHAADRSARAALDRITAIGEGAEDSSAASA